MARLVQLGPEQEADAQWFCHQHPEAAVFVSGWLADGGLRRRPQAARAWLFADRDPSGPVHGLVYVSDTGIVVPILTRDSGLTGLAELGRRNRASVRVVVGERSLVDALLGLWNFPLRLSRAQLAYAVERGGYRPRETLKLRTAEASDLDALMWASAEMAKEEAHDDPYSRNPKLFRTRIRERMERGRDFVFAPEGRLVFKCNVSALSPMGGQVEGIYTLPQYRGQGFGKRGTAAVTSWVLEQAERACLLVNQDNGVARQLYADLGYRMVYESRTVFFA